MILLKYSTASQEIPLGYFVDDSDGNTAETGLTIANTDIKLWKSGATTLANKNSGGATHISGGIYYCVLDATDTNTYGPLKIFVHASGALPVVVECMVMQTTAYDALMAGTLAESTGVPAANAAMFDKLAWMAMLARNKIEQTSSKTTLYDDAGTGAVAESTVSEAAGTFTRAEWIDSP